MYTYRISNTATEDLIRIYKYGLVNFGEIQTEKYYSDFFDLFDLITQNPYQFPSAIHIRKDYRFYVCGVDTIYYKINDTVIDIMAIIGRQDIETLL